MASALLERSCSAGGLVGKPQEVGVGTEGFVSRRAGEGEGPPGRTLRVRNIPVDVSAHQLEGLLQGYGAVLSVNDSETDRGLATVVYCDLRAADAARTGLEGHFLGGKILSVEEVGEVEEVEEKGRVLVRVEAHLGLQELLHIFSTYGDVRAVQSVLGSAQERVVEFYDVRDAEKVVATLNRSGEVGEGEAPPAAALLQGVGLERRKVLPCRETDSQLQKSQRKFLVVDVGQGQQQQQQCGYGSLGEAAASGEPCYSHLEQGKYGLDQLVGLPQLGGGGLWPPCNVLSEAKIKASDSASSFTQRGKDSRSRHQVQSSMIWGSSDSSDSRGSGTPTGSSAEPYAGSLSSQPSDSLLTRLPWGAGVEGGQLWGEGAWESSFFPGLSGTFGGNREVGVQSMDAQEIAHEKPNALSTIFRQSEDTVVGGADCKIDNVLGAPALGTTLHDLESSRSSTEGSGNFVLDLDEDPNHLLPPDLHSCMNSDKEDSTVSSSHPPFGYSQFADPMMAFSGPSLGMNTSCWSSHHGYGLPPQSTQYGPCSAHDSSMVNGGMATDAFLAQYYDSLNQTALLQQAVGREVLKRLASMAASTPNGSGLCSPDHVNLVDTNHKRVLGQYGGTGWGGTDKSMRRRGSRYGRKATGGDPAMEAERRAQQERMFALDLKRIAAGNDKRTTLMIKNIPNKYTQKMLLLTIEEECKGTFDFFYLPIDFKNRCNVGYGFINMMRPDQILPFVEKFHDKRWEKFNSEKVCCITYARIQGRAALINHFQNSSLMQEDSKHRPLLFSTDGQPEVFPAQMVA